MSVDVPTDELLRPARFHGGPKVDQDTLFVRLGSEPPDRIYLMYVPRPHARYELTGVIGGVLQYYYTEDAESDG